MNEFLNMVLSNFVEFIVITLLPYLGVMLGKFLNQLKEESKSREGGLRNLIIEQLATTAVYALEREIIGKGRGSERYAKAIDYVKDNLPASWDISEEMIRKSIEESFIKMEGELNLKGKK
jgi:hypothetical protein